MSDYLSANKQFIAPLPIPHATPARQAAIGRRARRLQRLHTRRRRLEREAAERLGVLRTERHDERWLWPDLPHADALVEQAPRKLTRKADRRKWAAEQLAAAREARAERFAADLARGPLDARFAGGEVRLLAGGAPVLAGVFADPAPGRATAAYWRWLILSGKAKDPERFAEALRRPPADADAPATRQFIERVDRLAATVALIARAEAAMNARLFRLYDLTPEEMALVQGDGRPNRGRVAA